MPATLTPHTPGTPWIAAIHGVEIETYNEAFRAGRVGWFPIFCMKFGIPTGTVIPVEAMNAASDAFNSRNDVAARDAAVARAKMLAGVV